MSSNNMKAVVITGVSSGFGLATTQALIDRGYRVFGTVRKQDDAERLQHRFGDEKFVALLCDVTDNQALTKAVETVSLAVGDAGITALVNNAGVAGSGPLLHTSTQQLRDVFEVNVFAVVAVTQAFFPLLKSDNNPGRVINISSISGGLTFPMLGVYSASKYALEALNDGLRREMARYGIEVSAIEPGTIRTSIWEKNPRDDLDNRFADTDYADSMAALPAFFEQELKTAKPISVVIDAIVDAIESRRPKARYPLDKLWSLRKFLSDRLLDKLIAKAMPL